MVYSFLFFFSGFASLLYQIVWLRLAFGRFGIIPPVISVVISVFMLGLGIGAWQAGRWSERFHVAPTGSWLRVYGSIELGIALWALIVPELLRIGSSFLLGMGQANSLLFLIGSAGAIALALIPACWLMGMTFPIMMVHFRSERMKQGNFSYLYRANVLGAFCGALVTPIVLIELLGFRWTNRFGVAINLMNACVSFVLARHANGSAQRSEIQHPVDHFLLWPLFLTGFVSMSFEVIWTRSFTPILGTTIYGFATIVAIYLAATSAGATWYRRRREFSSSPTLPTLFTALAFAAFLPLVVPRLDFLQGWIAASLVLAPFCALLGYLTPQIIDRYAQEDSRAAGLAYAVNILGCVLGPLVTGYVLLPTIGSKLSTIVLAGGLGLLLQPRGHKRPSVHQCLWNAAMVMLLVGCGIRFGQSRDEITVGDPRKAWIRHDYTASVIACGEGFDRRLLVNGIGLTVLTPLTKIMAHLPILVHTGHPHSALVICFGMGTTYRSLLSWGLRTTAVELVPSVPAVFGYYFSDAAKVIHNPGGRIVIDDGRRFLERTPETFDVITLDPPPPVEAAGSGLLYSKEFYELIKLHLAPDGVLQQWWPGGELRILQGAAQALREEFPYVRVYKGLGGIGYHFLASRQEMRRPSVNSCIVRMTPNAKEDLLEWGRPWSLNQLVQPIFEHEIPLAWLKNADHGDAILDDRPLNEYYLLRRLWEKYRGQYLMVR